MLGKDYSHIHEVKEINYKRQEERLGWLGVANMKTFIKALESVGEPVFKIRTTRFPVSNADLKDSWLEIKENGWHITLTWDTSMSGFNEIYLCEKLN